MILIIAIIGYDHDERSRMSSIIAIKEVLAGFPMSIYVEHCSPLGASCSTSVVFLTCDRSPY